MKIKNAAFLTVLLLTLVKPSFANQSPDSLEQFSVSDLKIFQIAYHEHCKTRVAYVLDPNGYVHHLEPGEYIGKHHGHVTRISKDTIYYTDLLPDGSGGFFQQKQEMKWLHPDSHSTN